MKFNRKDLSDTELLQLYRGILKPRMIEEKMLVLLRQGKVGKWFSGIGQEAISVGVTMALATEVYVLRDRLRALETQLAQHGAVDLGQLNQEAAPEELAQHQADRDAFVAHLLAPLLGQESSLGVKP